MIPARSDDSLTRLRLERASWECFPFREHLPPQTGVEIGGGCELDFQRIRAEVARILWPTQERQAANTRPRCAQTACARGVQQDDSIEGIKRAIRSCAELDRK